MSQKDGKRIIVLLLAATLLLTGCGAAPAGESTSPETTPPDTTQPAEAGPRYQVEWAKDAVIYEVNVRQYTREGTFKLFAEHLQPHRPALGKSHL